MSEQRKDQAASAKEMYEELVKQYGISSQPEPDFFMLPDGYDRPANVLTYESSTTAGRLDIEGGDDAKLERGS